MKFYLIITRIYELFLTKILTLSINTEAIYLTNKRNFVNNFIN